MSYLETISAGGLPWAYATLFLASVGANAAIVKSFLGRARSGRCLDDISAVQAMHAEPTPRVGGLAILASALALYPLSLLIDISLTKLTWYFICVIPLMAASLAEDFGHHVRPRWRIAASVASAALVIYFFGFVIDRTSIALLDTALAFTPFAIGFTLFATTGIVNAFNLIDGLNGLAAFTAIGVVVSLSIVAHRIGQPELVATVLLIAPILLGFLALNYPHGKIFLGDAGAYLVGFTLAWIAIAIYETEESLSPFAMLLIFFWPVADTLLAIWRRAQKHTSSALPDRLHFHQLTMRWLMLKTNISKRVANPVATLIILPMVFAPQAVGVLTWDVSVASLIALLACTIIFLASYIAGIKYAQRYRPGLSIRKNQLSAPE